MSGAVPGPTAGTLAPPRVLPRGRHAAPRAVVWRSQRERMLAAMAEAATDRGYGATAVADVVERAGVSRTAFYAHFENKEACFLAAYDAGVALVVGAIAAATRPHADDPLAALDAAVRAYLEMLRDNPTFAHTFLQEVSAAGPRALARRSAVHDRFGAMLATVNGDATAPPPPVLRRACVGAIHELVADHLRAHGAETLPDVHAEIIDVVVALLVRP